MIQRIVLYATLGALLTHLGHVWDTWAFWSIIALYWASEQITRQEGYEVGVVAGISTYINATESQRADLDKIVKDIND
jgi:hypothetical protein